MPVTLTDVYTASAEAPIAASGNIVKDFTVFRAGTFVATNGTKRKWSVGDLDQMVSNFKELKAKGILPHVPMRLNHSRDITKVVGYFQDLRRQGSLLKADLEFTEPDALEKYARGTYRARSAEMATYQTNDGDIYDPTFIGCAFCDIPAVEGLYEATIDFYSANTDDVFTYADAATPPAKPAGNLADDPDNDEFQTPDQAVKDILLDLHELKDMLAGNPDAEGSLQQIVDALTSISQNMVVPGDASDDGTSKAAGKTSTAKPSARANPQTHSQEGTPVTTFTFSHNGQSFEADEALKPVIDSLVAHAATLTTERDEAVERATAATATIKEQKFAARDTTVGTWLLNKKILPAQVEGMKAFARTLDDAQWDAYANVTENGPGITLTDAVVGDGKPSDDEVKDAKIAQHRETIQMLTYAGVTGEKLEQTAAFKALVALGANPKE